MTNLLNNTIKMIKPLDEKAMGEARTRQNLLTKPEGSLGRLEDLSIQIAGIHRKAIPEINHKAVITMAGDHGVVAEGVGNWPQEVTAQMVDNFLIGGAGINVMAKQAGARNIIVDIGVASEMKSNPKLVSRKVAPGTGNIAAGPAMPREQAVKAVETGIEIVNDEIAHGLDIVGTGDMGIGNTTASSAVCVAITGRKPSEVTGRGTGISDEQLKHKTEIVEKALALNRPDSSQPLDVLAKVGGLEIGGLTGVILGSAAQGIPVVIDGFISGAAALIAVSLTPQVKDYIIASHVSAEAGHRAMLEHIGLTPLFDLGLRLGEGTGAALGIFLCDTAVKVLSGMSTFTEAGVSESNEE
ncbi:MAG: nicotinate-nucleotide--dimethylbenzimidazole phosphoribosyltransferase [Dehalococcoidales bacterium]|nr:MAG: nicotinate-nucleotide--dimethylbenzimidazole phosphoribosyltransferase [Dehalococcoidales bacterium]